MDLRYDSEKMHCFNIFWEIPKRNEFRNRSVSKRFLVKTKFSLLKRRNGADLKLRIVRI